MTQSQELAEKIAKKAAEALAPLQVEMDLRKWPAEFRHIMWTAVATHARVLADEQKEDQK